jgi:predicted DNA-binding transcriptional regulator AlpA
VRSVKIDPADLLDAGEVAELLGLSRRQAVSTYRSRYSDFPAPIVEKNSGKCDLWLRSDVESWASSRRVG